jgi:hypothetical protein
MAGHGNVGKIVSAMVDKGEMTIVLRLSTSGPEYKKGTKVAFSCAERGYPEALTVSDGGQIFSVYAPFVTCKGAVDAETKDLQNMLSDRDSMIRRLEERLNALEGKPPAPNHAEEEEDDEEEEEVLAKVAAKVVIDGATFTFPAKFAFEGKEPQMRTIHKLVETNLIDSAQKVAFVAYLRTNEDLATILDTPSGNVRKSILNNACKGYSY